MIQTGQMTNNFIEAVQLRKTVGKLIPTLYPAQSSILDRYIQNTKIDELTRCIEYSNAPRRSGTSMIAAAIALAESRMGKSVLFVTDLMFEATNILERMDDLTAWGHDSLKEDTLKLGNSNASFRGRRFEIVIYESFVLRVNQHAAIKDVVDRLQFDTRCDLIYTIHA
jgi:hypothetical protein